MPNSIFILGEFSPGRLGYSYRSAFENLGYQTHTFELRSAYPLPWLIQNRIAHRLTRSSAFIRSTSLKDWNDQLVRMVLQSGADTILSLSMRFVSADTISKLRLHGIRVIMFYPDNPFPPHLNSMPETLPAARAADLCLIWSKRLVLRLRDAGVRRAEFLPFGWDSESFPWGEIQQEEFWPGVLFLGGWDREREIFLEQIAARIPVRIYGPDYWGKRTNPRGRVRQCWQGTDLRLADAAKVIRQSAVCVNILRTQHIIDGQPDAVIMRHFEVPGAGGLLLSTRDTTATSLFPEGETGEYFADLDECVAKANWFLQHESERESLIERAHSEVAAHHQYI
ncbi:MAG: glycosyltransferase, partial [Acidobacteriaceae bacterium]